MLRAPKHLRETKKTVPRDATKRGGGCGPKLKASECDVFERRQV